MAGRIISLPRMKTFLLCLIQSAQSSDLWARSVFMFRFHLLSLAAASELIYPWLLKWWPGYRNRVWLLEGDEREGMGQKTCFQKKITSSFPSFCRTCREIDLARQNPSPCVPQWSLCIFEHCLSWSLESWNILEGCSLFLAFIFVKTVVTFLMAFPSAF